MIGGVYFAGAPFAGVLRSGTTAAALAAAATLSVSTAAALDAPPQYLAGTAAITWTTAGALDSPPAYLAGDATIVWTTDGTMDRPPAVDLGAGIWIDGVLVTARVRVAGVTIRDILNDAPNTASFTIEGDAPAVGQSVRILTGDVLLFTGAVQTVDQTYELQPKHLAWDISAIDDTAEANARRPFGTFFDTSATTIAQTITTQFAPGFSTAGIAAGLPNVTIIYDGADLFIGCLTRLATAIGGYCKVFDRTVYLFTDDPAAPPDPLDDTPGRFLDKPPFSVNTDSSQLRTRVYGKGYGENVPADINAGETLIPITNGALFPPLGGTAIAALTPDGAQSERIAFTGVVLGGPGSLVGTGAAPGTAPLVNLAAGTGVESGTHQYATVFVTASGRTLPSPAASILVGTVAAPVGAPVPGLPTTAGSVTAGSHRYYAVFRTAAGSTTRGPASASATLTGVAAPTVIGHAEQAPPPLGDADLTPNSAYAWKYTFRRLSDDAETTASPTSNSVVTNAQGTTCRINLDGCQAAPSGYIRQWYRTLANTGTYKRMQELEDDDTFFHGEIEGYMQDGSSDSTLTTNEPSVNLTGAGAIPLTAIPVSPSALVTHVDLYREFNAAGAATARLALAVTNGTTTATDTVANASLGALVPASNTAVANRVSVSWSAGPSSVTNIEIYRSAANTTPLKLLSAVGSNAAGTLTDSTPDASLGAPAPSGDTSGLTQPSGQVNPGSAVVPVASSGPFRPAGGWVVLGGQVIRFTGVSGNTLTGIPASGSGAITTAVIYGQQAIPAPMLVGVTGLTRPMLKGSAVHIWIQRDDLQAQAEHAARTGGTGIVEFLIVDQRRGVDSLAARCDADLALFSRPIVTVGYATRDLKTKSGKPIVINLPSQRIQTTLTIQDVTITKLDIVPGLAPVFTAKASSVRFSLEDTLRRLVAGGQTEVNT